MPTQLLCAVMMAVKAPTRCAREMQLPGATALYTSLAAWVESAANAASVSLAWPPFVMWTGGMPAGGEALPPEAACVAASWTLMALVGVLLPSWLLHAVEHRSRSRLLRDALQSPDPRVRCAAAEEAARGWHHLLLPPTRGWLHAHLLPITLRPAGIAWWLLELAAAAVHALPLVVLGSQLVAATWHGSGLLAQKVVPRGGG